MHRVDTATAVAAPPAQNPVGAPGYFTQGSSTGSPPATVPGQDFFNSVQEELIGTIVAAGLAPSKADNTQLLQAIIALAGAYSFSSGTAMLFVQTAAPTGWTKSTTHNDKVLRVVSGTASSGGTTAFTSVFGAGKVTGGHVLSIGELPSDVLTSGTNYVMGSSSPVLQVNANEGANQAHDHTLSLDLQYVDIIIATKDA
ncbi:MAG: hypothetical protein Q7J84_15965 [Sulfuricaulis sp.]|nr:hypothetical protein [Sulfuricaulis sp.]